MALGDADEKAALLAKPAPRHVAAPGEATTWAVLLERYWVLILTSLMAGLQGMIWNTWGPVAPSTQDKFGWSNGDVALLANWGPICYFISVLPASWLMDVRGVQIAMRINTLVVLAGSAIRLIPTGSKIGYTVLVHAGQFLNGLAGPIAMSIPPVVSATFFPTEQRTHATAIMSVSNYIGVALSFVVGPAIVDNDHDVEEKVFTYVAGQTALALLCFFGTVLYFPNRPLDAPSRSAAVDRTDFWQGLRQLTRCPQFWACASSYGIITGMYAGWSAYLALNLEPFYGDTRAQDLAAWLGFWATLAGAVGGVGFGLFAEKGLQGRMKSMLMLLCVLSTLSYLWFALVCGGWVTHNKTDINIMLYVSCIFGGLVLNGTIPLFYESAVENAYPIAEGSTTCLLTTFNNLGCLIFLLIPMIPGINKWPAWANWSLVGGCAVSVLILFFYTEKRKRTSFDLAGSPVPGNQDNATGSHVLDKDTRPINI